MQMILQASDHPSTTQGDIRRRIEQIYELPPMPAVARRVLQLRNNPGASVAELAAIVELDPSLAAQVVRYAVSPFYAYRGKIGSIHDAITRVLGFDMVMNMALGLATGKSFRNPCDGPLGLHAFWQHAVYSATLVQALAKRMLPNARPQPGMAYLAGLLHNFGFLLLGHLFLPEFKLLNKLVIAHPESPADVLRMSDYIGSTSAIIEYCVRSAASEFIIVTESGVQHSLKKLAPGKTFHFLKNEQCNCSECPYMKMNTLEKLRDSLENLEPRVELEPELMQRALLPIERMLAIR